MITLQYFKKVFQPLNVSANEADQNGCEKNQQTQFCHAGPRSGIPKFNEKEEILNQVQNDIHFGQPQETSVAKQSQNLSNGVEIASQACNDINAVGSFLKNWQSLGTCLLLLFMISCSTPAELTDREEDLNEASISVDQLLESVPNYRESLQTISGRGRAIVSEPGNSERVTLNFLSNREESLITIRTSVGIEGGQIFVDSDSLLVYNRVDKFAEKVPLNQGKLTSVGSIASVNMLDLFNYTFTDADVDGLFDVEDLYVAILVNEARVHISKETGRVVEVNLPAGNRTVPYSRIMYEGYGEIDGFQLPRKITIFSQDGKSRATLLVQNLEINEELPELGIELPDDIPIYR